MKYTESHEWIRVEGNVGIIGVTAFAQRELGEIVYIELPKTGRFVNAGEEVAVLESTKAAVDVYSPVSGTILSVNEQLATSPDLVNKSPDNQGWIFKIQIENIEEMENLLDESEYQTLLARKS